MKKRILILFAVFIALFILRGRQFPIEEIPLLETSKVSFIGTIGLWFAFYVFKYLIIGSYYVVTSFTNDLHDIAGAEKKCASCGSFRLRFISGQPSEFYWKYHNKDGTRDKRRRDNVEIAQYKSVFMCKDCSEITGFTHAAHDSPSQNVSIVDSYHLVDHAKKNETNGKRDMS